jgi:hypothetical protein
LEDGWESLLVRPKAGYKTGLEEINDDLPEQNFWTAVVEEWRSWA